MPHQAQLWGITLTGELIEQSYSEILLDYMAIQLSIVQEQTDPLRELLEASLHSIHFILQSDIHIGQRNNVELYSSRVSIASVFLTNVYKSRKILRSNLFFFPL